MKTVFSVNVRRASQDLLSYNIFFAESKVRQFLKDLLRDPDIVSITINKAQQYGQ